MANVKLKNISDIYDELGLSVFEPLKIYAENYIKTKLQKYIAESMTFEKKYNLKFLEFKENIEKKTEDEDFDLENDLMDWEFAIKNILYWQEKLDRLGNTIA
jgi:hypothetical protein